MRVPCRACPLRELPAFKPNTIEEIDFIQSMKIDHLNVRAGDAILPQGGRSDQLFTLFSGWAFRFKELPDGRRQILNFLLPGDLIGFQAGMFGDAPFGVESLTDTEICVFSRPKIWELYRNYPELAFDVTWLTAHEESMVDEGLLTVGQRSAMERIAVLMLHLARRVKASGGNPTDVYNLPITQSHIADALGLSLAHTNKTLKALERKGLFAFSGGRLHLFNPRALEKLADYFDEPLVPRPLI